MTAKKPKSAQKKVNANSNIQATSGDYEKIINDTSTAINRMFETVYVDLLDRRAKAKAMASRFTSAVEDALEIIKYIPTSALGYLRAGEFFVMQGNQIKAVEIYAQGQVAVNKNDPLYFKLIEGEKQAVEQSKKRIDMISRMPLETTFYIFERLSLTTLAACLNVSKVWRERLYKCGSAWETLSSTGNEMTYTVNRELTAIGLWEMRNTLTRIDIDFTNNKVILSLSALLASAPNLTWLYYKTSTSLRKAAGDASALIEPHCLKQLQVESSMISGEDIQPILTKCQQLRSLVLIGCGSSVMDTVYSCCAELELFGYNVDTHITTMTQAQTERPQSTGLRVLDIGTPIHVEQLLPYFTKHSETLRVVFVALNELLPEELVLLDTWAYPVKMRELRIFHCQFAEETEHVVARLIKDCSELRNVLFDNVDNMDILSRELVKADKLSKLYLANIQGTVENELQRLFDKHVLLGDESQLSYLRFQNVSTLSNAVINGLRCLKKLKVLEFYQCEGMTASALSSVIPDIKSLTEIKFYQVDAVDDQVVRSLGSIKTVRLVSMVNVHDVSVRHLIEHSSRLEIIEVRNCPNCSENLFKFAIEKGKKMIN
ncbi:hypothetical protein INT45_011625 [Circinella minor]|uniref:F-box domain-containing protein n=1 Tax=Circinella minor TaxID=1195481 RepID=A0A8H7VJG8_9FUNG|nr:hypothetical protein INT45_011625 [Circinella minor]